MKLERNFDILDYNALENKLEIALSISRNGQWENFSIKEYKEMADNFSYGLLELGFKKGDKILTISNNRPEWNFVDMGLGQIGCVHVPVYPNISTDEHAYILEHSDARLVILSSKEHYENIKPLGAKISKIEKICTFDNVERAPNWMEIIELGKANKSKYEAELQKIKDSISKDDLLSIIYTSGTTGRSKGVMLTHYNFMSNVEYSQSILPDGCERFLSFLPLCHVFERMVNYLIQARGVAVYYAENMDSIGKNLNEIHAHGFAAVPRVLEKLYDKILLKGKELKGVKRSIFFWAVNLGLRYELNNANGYWYELQLKLANKLVFNKWREALGGEVKIVVSGGAALQPRLARIFTAAGIPLLEGYGLTETSPVISVNHINYPLLRFGTVGPVLDNVEVKIAEDGEILMKGPSLMQGYYKDPERTLEAIDKDGWFHTGDIGELSDHRILKITDRKKEIFKLSTGKYVAPQVVENIFKESPLIEQLLVVGESEKFAAAIISPSFHYLHGWCFKNNIKFRGNVELVNNPKVIKRYQEEIDRINMKLGKHEQIIKFSLTCKEWGPETGELSPTLKLKRNLLKKVYKVKLDFLYGYTVDCGDLEVVQKPKED
ncbi:MAG: long-chain fatty acid--CoA ligase [Bacteroidetes bacterium CG2_30_33_31]|nr:MAG: long-chain fatty acid--CoA ligase [Bacteroidetes bacterium CG2_30_33_31]